MEIDKKQLRQLLLWMWGLTESARTELIAHKVALVFLKAAGKGQGFDQFSEQSRKNPSPLLLAENQAVRDTIDKLLGEEKPAALLAFLQNWKPQGPIQ